jgi:methylthioribose-1-phosphate isomerase
LPAAEQVITCSDVPALIEAIQRLAVRGAPLLGVAGAYGVALAACRGDDVRQAAADLERARPTAVNLAWGVRRALAACERAPSGAVAGGPVVDGPVVDGPVVDGAAAAALAEAGAIAAEDAAASAAMAVHGLSLVPDGARVLTHCNTGALVSAGEGTAFAVILAAHRAGTLARLWIDETRPLLQGARLTAYEARAAGIPHAVLTDGAAASLMAAGQVDLIVLGADRIAADGSVANKIGTYGLAVLARHHQIPFVVVAPVSTVDFGTAHGASITVEHRPAAEVTSLAGQPLAPPGTAAYSPAFDVTPPDLVTALVTERGIIQPVTAGNLRHLDQAPAEVQVP